MDFEKHDFQVDPNVFLDKELFIFDLDGTIYLSDTPFPFAIEFINNLRQAGKKILFFTNNASRTVDFYVKNLTKIGFPASREEIITAGTITIDFLKNNRTGKNVYLVGTDELKKVFQSSGFKMLTGEEKNADIVVSSFDTELTYKKLDNACRFIRNGAEFISTHPDLNCPTATGFMPDSGAIAAAITASTGKSPLYLGKPCSFHETIEKISSDTNVPLSKMCVFGDRLYTDIALGKKHGFMSILVYTGEATPNDIEDLPADERPDYAFASLKDVNEIMFGE